jgi:hypothetical protein
MKDAKKTFGNLVVLLGIHVLYYPRRLKTKKASSLSYVHRLNAFGHFNILTGEIISCI